jgi:hypothetical protein
MAGFAKAGVARTAGWMPGCGADDDSVAASLQQ